MRKFLFIPHCLRKNAKCVAEFGRHGYTCARCGACKIDEISRLASERNFEVFIVPGSSLIKKIFKELKIGREDLVIGIACDAELEEVRERFWSKKPDMRKIAVKLTRDGCINTDVSIEEVKAHLVKDY